MASKQFLFYFLDYAVCDERADERANKRNEKKRKQKASSSTLENKNIKFYNVDQVENVNGKRVRVWGETNERNEEIGSAHVDHKNVFRVQFCVNFSSLFHSSSSSSFIHSLLLPPLPLFARLAVQLMAAGCLVGLVCYSYCVYPLVTCYCFFDFTLPYLNVCCFVFVQCT